MTTAAAVSVRPFQAPLPATPASDDLKSRLRDIFSSAPGADLSAKDVLETAGLGDAAFLGVSATGGNVAAHEEGHALAAHAMFQGTRTTISINPLKGGVTSWSHTGGLTAVGQHFGNNGAVAVISAAGPAVDTALGLGTFALGYHIRHQHPIAGKTLMGYGAFSILNDVIYAGSAIGGDQAALAATGNDFASIALHAGVTPLVSAAVLAASIPAEYLIMREIEKHLHKGGAPSAPAAPAAKTPAADTREPMAEFR